MRKVNAEFSFDFSSKYFDLFPSSDFSFIRESEIRSVKFPAAVEVLLSE